MPRTLTVEQWMQARKVTFEQLRDATGIAEKTLESIVRNRYTTSPQQRRRIADALNVTADEIAWGQAVPTDSMYGHGPQFGRSP